MYKERRIEQRWGRCFYCSIVGKHHVYMYTHNNTIAVQRERVMVMMSTITLTHAPAVNTASINTPV